MKFEFLNRLIKKDQRRDEVDNVKQERIKQKETDEDILTERNIKSLERQSGWDYTNIVKICELKDDGGAIFKPRSGECRGLRKAVENGTFYKREVATYLVDTALEFGLVPPTVVREINEEIGSLQKFIDEAKMYYEIVGEIEKKEEFEKHKKELIKMWIFDYIIWNSDRRSSNFLMKDGSVYAIDNGLSFGEDSIMQFDRSFKIFDEQIPKDIIEKIDNFLSDDDKKEDLKNKLGEFISAQEISACISRIKNIQKLMSKGYISSSEKDQLTFR